LLFHRDKVKRLRFFYFQRGEWILKNGTDGLSKIES
jgi:hypothetical protein